MQQQPINVVNPTVTSINTLVILGLIFTFIIPLLGLILSAVAKAQIRRNPGERGKALATAGLFISIGLIILAIMFIIGAHILRKVASGGKITIEELGGEISLPTLGGLFA